MEEMEWGAGAVRPVLVSFTVLLMEEKEGARGLTCLEFERGLDRFALRVGGSRHATLQVAISRHFLDVGRVKTPPPP